MNIHAIAPRLVGVLALLAATACNKDKEVYTIVEGTIADKYTNQPVAGVKLEVDRTTGCWMCSGRRDSVTNAVTDASGTYKVSFNASNSGSYSLRTFSPSNYLVSGSEQGAEVKTGQPNRLDYKATPYKTVTVRVNSSKKGKSDIQFIFFSGGLPGETGDFNGDIFTDTNKNTQTVSFTKTIRVLPDRVYRFTKITSNQVCPSNPSFCTWQDQEYEVRTRDIRYTNDTATVGFQ